MPEHVIGTSKGIHTGTLVNYSSSSDVLLLARLALRVTLTGCLCSASMHDRPRPILLQQTLVHAGLLVQYCATFHLCADGKSAKSCCT